MSKDLNEQFKKHLTNSEPLDCEYRACAALGGRCGAGQGVVAKDRRDASPGRLLVALAGVLGRTSGKCLSDALGWSCLLVTSACVTGTEQASLPRGTPAGWKPGVPSPVLSCLLTHLSHPGRRPAGGSTPSFRVNTFLCPSFGSVLEFIFLKVRETDSAVSMTASEGAAISRLRAGVELGTGRHPRRWSQADAPTSSHADVVFVNEKWELPFSPELKNLPLLGLAGSQRPPPLLLVTGSLSCPARCVLAAGPAVLRELKGARGAPRPGRKPERSRRAAPASARVNEPCPSLERESFWLFPLLLILIEWNN